MSGLRDVLKTPKNDILTCEAPIKNADEDILPRENVGEDILPRETGGGSPVNEKAGRLQTHPLELSQHPTQPHFTVTREKILHTASIEIDEKYNDTTIQIQF